ncbi:hypothetical protein [Rubrimonas cliftonensis]|uniref:VPLPA-CTERM protein sorting domain-containing protein n=1 Tax=Rubrimonas cliftonensis TaxID=89524 RepID=A0A1H4GEH8_9RHOB|nr:hypothetical protein [Rubrimonas cliftonensis]SEB07400.1 hypothetical protein SAMN05444370_1534 [Rubrimonas cliftonensis]
MFRKTLPAIALLPIVLAAAPSGAATLSVITLDAPTLTGVGDASNSPGLFDFEFFGVGAVSSEPAEATGLDIDIVAEILADGSVGPEGGLLLVGPGPQAGGFFLTGDLTDVAFSIGPGEDVLELLFEVISGPAEYGMLALARIFGDFGDDAASAFGSNGFDPTDARFELHPAVIPLPAALPMAVSALALLAAFARRRRASPPKFDNRLAK